MVKLAALHKLKFLILWTSLGMLNLSIILMLNSEFNKSMINEMELHMNNNLSFYFSWIMDYYTITFSMFVLLISSMIFMFAQYYMNNSNKMNQFRTTLFLFVLSMLLLIFSPNFLIMMIGWDGLGIISFFLIIFYNNSSSNNAGMLTFLINRLGDMFFIASISFMWINLSWSIEQNKWMNLFLMIMFIITGMTKSAQIPFSSWLPNAMAAPTPVSSLVHSSTLVTAGIFIFIRFNYSIKPLYMVLFIISISTLLMSGFMANFEWDSKKMIAFSTLSQLGLMMSSLSLNLIFFCFFHLITHALFKSTLFMLAGINIHNSNNSQDMRNNIPSLKTNKLLLLIFIICFLALMSFPFTSGFFSKDLIIDSSFNNNTLFILYLLSIFLTILYSMRFCIYNLWNLNNSHTNYFQFYINNIFLIMPIWMLSMCALMSGYFMLNIINNLMFLIIFTLTWKLFYFVIFFSLIIMSNLFSKFKNMINFYFLSNMWYLYYLNNQLIIKSSINTTNKMVYIMDQSSIEITGPYFFFNQIQKTYFIISSTNNMIFISNMLFMISLLFLI